MQALHHVRHGACRGEDGREESPPAEDDAATAEDEVLDRLIDHLGQHRVLAEREVPPVDVDAYVCAGPLYRPDQRRRGSQRLQAAQEGLPFGSPLLMRCRIVDRPQGVHGDVCAQVVAVTAAQPLHRRGVRHLGIGDHVGTCERGRHGNDHVRQRLRQCHDVNYAGQHTFVVQKGVGASPHTGEYLVDTDDEAPGGLDLGNDAQQFGRDDLAGGALNQFGPEQAGLRIVQRAAQVTGSGG